MIEVNQQKIKNETSIDVDDHQPVTNKQDKYFENLPRKLIINKF